mmetsp:Transcript_8859/g.21062  ORF Transcript_8859/g.21062 Transcript_8859/m.21062 type:complete len:242 (+) Transcript_8859:226-951(+)
MVRVKLAKRLPKLCLDLLLRHPLHAFQQAGVLHSTNTVNVETRGRCLSLLRGHPQCLQRLGGFLQRQSSITVPVIPSEDSPDLAKQAGITVECQTIQDAPEGFPTSPHCHRPTELRRGDLPGEARGLGGKPWALQTLRRRGPVLLLPCHHADDKLPSAGVDGRRPLEPVPVRLLPTPELRRQLVHSLRCPRGVPGEQLPRDDPGGPDVPRGAASSLQDLRGHPQRSTAGLAGDDTGVEQPR